MQSYLAGESTLMLHPSMLLKSRATRFQEQNQKPVSHFAKISKAFGRATQMESNFSRSIRHKDSENLIQNGSISQIESVIKLDEVGDEVICFGDLILLTFPQIDFDGNQKSSMVMTGEGFIKNSIAFRPLSSGSSDESTQDCLFRIIEPLDQIEAKKPSSYFENNTDFNLSEFGKKQTSDQSSEATKIQHVCYGQGFRLVHLRSGKILDLVNFLDNEQQNAYRFELIPPTQESSLFKFYGCSRATSVGSHIFYRDSVLIKNEKMVAFLSVQKSKQALSDEFSFCLGEGEETKWKLGLYQRESIESTRVSSEDHSFKDGVVVQIYMPETDSYFCCIESRDEGSLEKLVLVYPSQEVNVSYSLEVTNLQNPFFVGFKVGFRKNMGKSLYSLWELRRKKFGKNETIGCGEELSLRHIVSGGFLKFNSNDNKFYFQDSSLLSPFYFNFCNQNGPEVDVKLAENSQLLFRSEDFFMAFRAKHFNSQNSLEGDNDGPESSPSLSGDEVGKTLEFSKTNHAEQVLVQIRPNRSLEKIALIFTNASRFFIKSHELLTMWDMSSRNGNIEYDFQIAIKNKQQFMDCTEKFRTVISELSRTLLHFQSQTKGTTIDFDALEKDYSGFDEAIESTRIIENLIEIINLLIAKSYAVSLKMLNMQNEKDEDNNDFLTYHRLFNALQKSTEKKHIRPLAEIPTYEDLIRKILPFFVLLAKQNVRFACKIMEESDFILKIYHFFEDEIVDLISAILPATKIRQNFREISVGFLKNLFSVEKQSRFLMHSSNYPTFFPKLIGFMDLRKSPDLCPFLSSHLLLSKPFIYMEAMGDNLPKDNDPFASAVSLSRDTPQDDVKYELLLNIPEGEFIRRVQ